MQEIVEDASMWKQGGFRSMIEKFGHFELQKYLQLMAQLLHKLFFFEYCYI